MKKIIGLIPLTALSLIFISCAPKANELASHINNVNLGTTKQEVIKTMGNPFSSAAIDGTEFLKYKLCIRQYTFAESPIPECSDWAVYYVRLRNNKVDSYGRLGDFDSTNVPETKQTINLNINQK